MKGQKISSCGIFLVFLIVPQVHASNGLAFIREANAHTNGANNVWVAWHENANERAIVRWDASALGWYQWNPTTNSWFIDSANSNKRKKWNGTTWSLE